MNLQDFNQIDLKTAGNLPLPVKAVLLGVMLLLIVAAGYWFVWSPSLEELDQAKAKEGQLREVFVTKKRQAINLEAYKKQMVEIERTFGALLKQLPDKSQMDGLLTDINQVGLERGLEFELFKPGQEVVADFYAEMPISIKVIGNYHDLGLFAADVSRLSRIVTLNDIAISSANKDSKDSKLVMEAVAKTYRYLDANEVAAKKAADKAIKK
ncbi:MULTISPECIES: type 4a pilus biogenesis protein PilO [Methylovorus]|jgi:type IV pilus assembly protein PilO|uniref:Pilus assembly protein PilO n=1 Tax=Methylovorus glucosotrophus (strain SIP3-4) TaxID=582744 RepID=C6XAX1_METGS|nr:MULTISPECIES: type 4a pilus biogenesis protein PilO [Methylovorus]ACT51741.1 Pilus assembly protein PilO [Methylovorus glucosotrophus SIP3-4]ADQ85593.1 Pilus assembly protein PilO [Methylovorus sp. MP688]KAF0842997.1 type IV pilus assembly protein PilO [Methylovorus glucosotrophus]